MINNIINLGTLGSVSDGKSEMIYQLSGIRTQRDSREKKRNITIKAGYANIKIWKCNLCFNLYSSKDSEIKYNCLECNNDCIINNHISFVDCPGHQELIETMMSSISLMKGAIVIISVVEPLKQKPQLLQHLISAKMANLDKLIICMNKCDLVSINIVKERKQELDELLNKLDIKPLIIIPTSFTHKLGINYLINAINKYFSINENEIINDNVLFRITRSFDINQPGINYDKIQGGCIGGSLISGKLEINDEVEINPGILTKNKDGRYTCEPIITKLLSFESDKIKLDFVKPGGLVGILTNIDPYYCKNDMLKGNIITKIGKSLPVYNDIIIEFKKIDYFEGEWIPKNGDKVYLQISNMFSESRLTKVKNNKMNFQLMKPLCIDNNAKIMVCIKQPILKIVGIGQLLKN